MNFHQNPSPNWAHHHFGANIDPFMDFELSDYLVMEEAHGSVVDQQLDSLSSQSFPSPENNFAGGDGGGHGGSTDQPINNTSGATSSNTNMQVLLSLSYYIIWVCLIKVFYI